MNIQCTHRVIKRGRKKEIESGKFGIEVKSGKSVLNREKIPIDVALYCAFDANIEAFDSKRIDS